MGVATDTIQGGTCILTISGISKSKLRKRVRAVKRERIEAIGTHKAIVHSARVRWREDKKNNK